MSVATVFTDSQNELSLVECGNIITYGGPWATVPELMFEKKVLIPEVQQLLVAESIC